MDFENLKSIELPGFSYRVCQTKSGQTVTQDTQSLLDFVLDRYSNQTLTVLELGSGTGVLSILLKLHRPNWVVTGIEIQRSLWELSNWNASNCNVLVRFIEGDLRIITQYIPEEKFDLVISNPPFYKIGEHRLSIDIEKAISRHEVLCTMDNVVSTVSQKLKPGGKAFLAYPSKRVEELKEKIKNIDLQFIAAFSLSTESHDVKDRTTIVELAYADHR